MMHESSKAGVPAPAAVAQPTGTPAPSTRAREDLGPNRPLVSIVVIGRNEGERLSQCLRAVRAMNFRQDELELIYVDSHSSDDSLVRAREHGAQILVLPPGPTTAARGRNAGYRAAKGPFLLFLDGDAILDPNFLAGALRFLEEHPDVAVYWGQRRELHPQESVYNRVLDLDWLFPSGESTYCGGDALMRRGVIDQVGPFRDDLIAGEEPELCARIRGAGHRVWHADVPMTRHDLAIISLAAYLRRAYRSGHAYAEVADLTQGALFKRESVKNHIQTAVYLVVPLGLTTAFGWTGVWVLMAAAGLIVFRTAWRNRWRQAPLATTLLYSIHAHFCQLPIWLGQLAYHFNRHRQSAHEIIEYK